MLTLFTLCLTVGLAVLAQPTSYQGHKIKGHNRRSLPQDDVLIDPMYGQPEPQPLIDIFPPKYYPGEVMKSTEFSKVDQALNEVMKSGDLFHDRRCALGVSNEGQALLSNPIWTMTSGGSHSALPQEVPSGQTGLNLFLKTKGTARGSVGVLSYDIAATNHKLVVMWLVPFDRNLFDGSFNMKVYERHVSVDKHLEDHLKKQGGPFPTNAWHTRTEYGVKMRGTMTDTGKSKLIVFVNADDFDANAGYDLTTECKYHPGKVRKYCKQECYGGGWCWVNSKCRSDSECTGRHSCMSGC